MKKKLLCVLLAASILLALPSCAASDALFVLFSALSSAQNTSGGTGQDKDHSVQSNDNKTANKHIEKLAYDEINPSCQTGSFPFGFYWLEEGIEQRLYKNIMDAAFRVAQRRVHDEQNYRLDTISCEISVSDVQFMKVLTAFLNDNPHVFWLCSDYDYYEAGNTRYFQLYSYLSAEDCEQEQRRFYNAVKEIISGLPKNPSELEAEKYLHDYLVDHCSYDEDGRWQRYTPYGAIIQGKAVCEGYSEAMQILLNCAGVRTTVVRGESGGELHEWNLVQIDFEWYHLDVTWDDSDSAKESGDELYRYYYFNVDSTFIEANDHTISPLYEDMTEDEIANEGGEYMEQFNLYLPDCVTMDANYYYQNAAVIANSQKLETKVLDKLISTIKNKKPYFYIRCGKKTDPVTVDHDLFDGDIYYQYVEAANASNKTGGKQVKSDGVRTYTLDGYDDLIIAQMDYVT